MLWMWRDILNDPDRNPDPGYGLLVIRINVAYKLNSPVTLPRPSFPLPSPFPPPRPSPCHLCSPPSVVPVRAQIPILPTLPLSFLSVLFSSPLPCPALLPTEALLLIEFYG